MFKYKLIVRSRKIIKMPKRRYVFTQSLEAEYRFLKEDQQVGKMLCFTFKSQISREHGGCSSILQHIKKRKHTISAETKKLQ
jgi:hypothetical protein